ncbi:hypothetical protein QYM36_008406 [Artemia franciscana]|uniref:NADH dehydrogenase [ubiquinone] 1 beta subcomplex subunit 10 n=1 Tax=Artemia franciscana TaxID=6661 RepID=A0AA88LI37_ARTSF|nr:hypothetical protein QYM36_008406 [Artemia franciscana]
MGGTTDYEEPTFLRGMSKVVSTFTAPARYFRENIVEPNRKQDAVWYHRTFRRVPTIDECYTDDYICRHEADEQFKRDRLVDQNICNILKNRFTECLRSEHPDIGNCDKIKEDWQLAETNYFSKYGAVNHILLFSDGAVNHILLFSDGAVNYILLFSDGAVNHILLFSDGEIGVRGTVIDAFMRQKHRMAWERRHGPIGTGMKESV